MLKAFEDVPREDFLPDQLKEHAYDDRAMPLLQGQTISQPSTVMIMTQALRVQEGMTVLDIGSGSGYQAALLATLAGKSGQVYATEIVAELCAYAQERLQGYDHVRLFHRDGIEEMKEFAPFDRILVAAACPRIPQPLIDQLREGGILVAPVGTVHEQKMIVGKKERKELITHSLGDFVFVPLTGKWGFTR